MESEGTSDYLVGVDVGTGSVRAALVNKYGKILKVCTHEIKTWHPKPNFYQQSSEDIWTACCFVIRSVTEGVSANNVKGIGFDATCSLVVLDSDGKPLTVDLEGDNNQNIILWLDHRATAETDLINETRHPVLRYTGGKISCEMMAPKLLWLKSNMYDLCWKNAGHFMLLPDFLSWKATSSENRSLCSIVCKCTYVASPSNANDGWSETFFKTVGMEELAKNNWKLIGSHALKPGDKCGTLTEKAANQLGLLPGTVVSASLIDAHAGGVALMGCTADGVEKSFTSKIALICGTSTCHMAISGDELFVLGVWGPYYNSMIPNVWLIEGGQSATGKLIDHIIATHPATACIKQKSYLDITEYLNNLLWNMAKEKNLESVDELTESVHVYPDFHGNRSPLSDPTLKGMISGLTLASTEEDLALLYLATVQSLVYQTKHILEQIKQSGHEGIKSILCCGGLSKNTLFLQQHANAIGLPVLYPQESDMMLVGAAMLAASAANLYPSLNDAIFGMGSRATYVKPLLSLSRYHECKYKVFHEMLNHQKLCRDIMKS